MSYPDFGDFKLPAPPQWFIDAMRAARAEDHFNAVKGWPWYGRLIHRVFARKCECCIYARSLLSGSTKP